MRLPEKEYYRLSDLADKDEWNCKVDDLLHFGETGQLEMCVVLPSTIVEITRLTPINELDENSKWAKLINEPHEDSEQAKGEDPLKSIHEAVKMVQVSGPYHLFADTVTSIRKGEGIESVHDGNFDTNRMFYRFLNDNGCPANKNFNSTDIVIPYEEKIRFEAACDLASSDDIGEKERTTWLKIIYLLMHKLANYQASLVKTSGINMSQLEKVLKKAAKEHDLSDKGLSNSTLSEIYKAAKIELMPHSPSLIKKITK